MTVKAGHEADLYIASGTSVTFTEEACTNAGDDQTFTITDAAKRFWDRTEALTIEVDDGGGFDPAPANTVQYCGGVITFDSPLAGAYDVRVSGKYYAVSQLAQAHRWQLDIAADVLPAPQFGNTWTPKVVSLRGGSAQMDLHWADDTLFTEIAAANPLVGVLYTDYSAGSRYEFFCQPAGESVGASVESLVSDGMTVEIDGEVFYSAS